MIILLKYIGGIQMLKSISKILVIFFMVMLILFIYVKATDINMNLTNSIENSVDNNIDNEIDNSFNTMNTQYSNPTITSSLPEAELGLGNILNILLIVVGVLLILLGIAIIIRLKS